MADNFNITQGTGTAMRAVEKSSKKTQVVAIDIGGAGAESLLTTSMPVLPVKSSTVQPTVTPTLTVAATYASGDYVGTSGTPMEFQNCAYGNGYGGYVLGAMLVDGDLQNIAAELWLFDSTVTPPADSAAWSISDADAAKVVAVIPFSVYYASALNSVSSGQPDGGAARFVCGVASSSLFGCLVTRGAPAYTSGKVTVRLTVVQD